MDKIPDGCIHICHVGSRDSGWSDNPLVALGKDIFFTLFDADKDAVEKDKATFHMKKKSALVGSYRFINACLADKESVRDFYIMRDPMTSGLLPFNEQLSDFMTSTITFNYSLKDAATVVETRKIKCTTIDKLFVHDIPDVISLDAEGSEYDILQGAKETLPHVLCIKSETLFVEYRKKQKLFSHLFDFLVGRGFFFVSLDGMYPMNYKESLDFARGAGFPFAAEAIFLKDYSTVLDGNDIPLFKIQKILKLAAIALVLNLTDYAFRALDDTAAAYPQEFNNALKEKTKYVHLCSDFYRVYKRAMHKQFARQSYFAANKEFWNTHRTSLVRKTIRRKWRDTLWAVFKKGSSVVEVLHYYFMPYNSIECMFVKYDLHGQAQLQKMRRARAICGPKTLARRLRVI